jgi:hypothetical protein
VQQGTLLVAGLVVALTIAHLSSFATQPVSRTADIVNSPEVLGSSVNDVARPTKTLLTQFSQ